MNNKDNILQIGTVLHGTYRIESYLSSGGFGNTYVAVNQFGEKRAVKEFFIRGINERMKDNTSVSVSNSDQKPTFEQQLKKFKKEALRLHNLNSAHIVKVYDFFEENGTAYYVMDYVEGYNLKDKLNELGHPMSEKTVCNLLAQLLEALDSAHNAGVWHLDLKPSNIMIDKQGFVKLIDFGASKQQRRDGSGATMTNSIVTAYTPGYAPSEQIFGPWTDFYALGATLYTLLTGDKPAGSYKVERDTTTDKYKSLPLLRGLSQTMRELILWLMQPQRQNRPQSVADIRKFLAKENETTIQGKNIGKEDDTTILEAHEGTAEYNKQPIKVIANEEEDSKSFPWGWLIAVAIVVVIFGYKSCGNTETTSNKPSPQPVDSILVDSVYADTTIVDTAMESTNSASITTEKPKEKELEKVKSVEKSSPVMRDIRPRTVSVGRSVTTKYHHWTLVSLELLDDLTIAHWRVTSRMADTGIWNEGNERIINRNTGESYKIIDKNGIGTPSYPTYIQYSGQTVTFENYFPAIANGTESVDYDMGNNIIRNIQLR